MFEQLKLERFKAARFYMIYIAIALIAAAGGSYGYLKFPEGLGLGKVFADAVCDTSLLFVPATVTAWLLGNDFLYRTIHNPIKLGSSRASVIMAKALTAFAVSLMIHLTDITATIVGYGLRYGFDSSLFTTGNLLWLLVVMVQVCAITSFVVLIVFAAKNALAGIALTVVFTFITCNILRNFLDGKTAFKLSCFSLAQTNDVSTLVLSGIFAAITIAVVLGLTQLVFRKAEIK
ncbi:ABC transporter permease [Ruminococcus sp.]|uniref:ABC transporter permease n=1 Tax=Ruminococcus sp. TaxID=41978 RepID=UPI0025DFE00D|nr:ABC transporter permease [Ruminococcus sp.]MBQ8967827.1 ABC transporter permease [Ruminococcus sp.]